MNYSTERERKPEARETGASPLRRGDSRRRDGLGIDGGGENLIQ